MKARLLLLCIWVTPLLLFSQSENWVQNNDEVLDSILTWKFSQGDSTLSYRHARHYDNQKRLIEEITYNWESTIHVWAPYRKDQYGYDQYGNQNLNATLFYEDALAQWVGAWKQDYVYKANGQLLEFYLAGWDYDNNDWTPPVKQLYDYLANDSLDCIYKFSWNELTETYDSTEKEKYYYNADGLVERIVGWVEDENQPGFLVPEQKYEFSFDAAGNRSGFYQYWYNQIWYDMVKATFEYDDQNRKIEEEYYSYQWQTEYWYPMNKYEYGWTNDGLLNLYIDYTVIEADTSWWPVHKQEAEYSASNQFQFENYYAYLGNDNWFWSGKVEYTYSAADLLTEYMAWTRDTTSTEWTGQFRYTYSYDSMQRQHSESYYNWVNITHDFELISSDYYYYSTNTPWAVNENLLEGISIGPNPCNGTLSIFGLDEAIDRNLWITLSDNQGRQVLQTSVFTFQSTLNLDLNGIPPGVYLLTIRSGQKTVSEKVMIQ